MVDRTKIDIKLSTIAVLTVPPKQPVSLGERELEKILTPPLTIGQSSDGLFVASQRDQIDVVAGGIKINVRDLSGRRDFSPSKVPSVLHYFVQASASQVKSYGINFVLTAPCVNPEQWIRENILASQISEKMKKPLIGGWGQLKIESGRKVWTIKIEPKEGDMIAVDFNAHEDIEQLPDESSLRQEMQEQFGALITLLEDLGVS